MVDLTSRFYKRHVAETLIIGERPTFGVNARTVETHLIGFEGDLYGQEITIELVERLRGEERFSGIEALKAQIQADVAQAVEILG